MGQGVPSAHPGASLLLQPMVLVLSHHSTLTSLNRGQSHVGTNIRAERPWVGRKNLSETGPSSVGEGEWGWPKRKPTV